MAHVDKHHPGSFCWMELGTTDQAAAKKFYGDLLGWKPNDIDMGPGGVYTIFQLDGRDCAACYNLTPDAMSRGLKSHWTPYIAVEDADASAARATQLGGEVKSAPFDVGPNGRMANIVDPTGAPFAIWQPKQTPGIGIKNSPGAFCWADLNTSDRPTARRFYESLFGWMFDPGKGKDDDGYLHIRNGEHYQAGMLPEAYRNKHAPPHWILYFTSSNCDASTKKAKDLGAHVFVPSMKIENQLTYSVLADPQGALFALFEPNQQKPL